MFGQGQSITTPKPPTPIQPSLPLQQQQQQPQVHTPTHPVPPFPQQLQLQQQQPTPTQHQLQPQVQTPQGFIPVPSTPVPSSPGRKRRLTGQGVLDAQPSPQFGGLGGSGLTGMNMNNPGNVGAGGLMTMPQSMGSPNPTLLGGAGGGLMGPPHVVPSRANSLGGPVSLDEGPDLFLQQITAPQTSLPPQVPQAPMAATPTPFQTPSGVPSVGIGGAGMRQRQAVVGTPGFGDVQAPLPSPVVQRMAQTVVTPAQMQMQMQGVDALTINTGLPEVPGLPVVPDANVPVPLPHPHPPTAPTSATSSATTLPTLPTAASSSAPAGNKTMRVTLVSPADIKPVTEKEVEEVKGWMSRDKEYEAVYRSMKERMAEELRVSRAESSDMWWEVSDGKKMRTKFGITYPGQRFRDNRKRGRREGFRL
jgi:SWI/SNF-related matrix-associated actin-dependent regulator of chromatin subfamily B protein 1